MDHSLISFSSGTRLVCVNSRDDQNLVCNLILDFTQAQQIVAHSILIICRAGTDNGKKFVRFSGKYVAYFLIPFFF